MTAWSDRRGRGPALQDWVGVERSLDANGNAVLPGLRFTRAPDATTGYDELVVTRTT